MNDLPPMHTPNVPLATERQIDFAISLLGQLTSGDPIPPRRSLEALSRYQISAMIDDMLATIREDRAREAAERAANPTPPPVPDGRYCIDYQGDVKFYRVRTPTEGKWAGYTFLDAQGGGDYYAIRNKEYRSLILEAILDVGPREASLRYGRELGTCGVCGRELTDADSRARGIGPICATKQGW